MTYTTEQIETARIDNEWFRCPRCGHKLGKMVGRWNDRRAMPAIEIKCHSCGEKSYLMIRGQNNNEN